MRWLSLWRVMFLSFGIWLHFQGTLAAVFETVVVNPNNVHSTPAGTTQESPSEPIRIDSRTCLISDEDLREFAQTAPITPINGDGPFEMSVSRALDNPRAILVDVASDNLNYWNLSYTSTPAAYNLQLLLFEPIGFDCATFVVLVGESSNSNCSLLTVTSVQTDQPPPDGSLVHGTFISGGIDGENIPEQNGASGVADNFSHNGDADEKPAWVDDEDG